MSAFQFPISQVINVSVTTTPVGVNEYNTSNLAIFTDEIPGDTFGNLGYAIYNEPTQASTDFGSGSKTAQMVTAIFSQQPNVLAGNGSVIVILLNIATQTLTPSGVAASGTFEITFNGHSTAAINWNDSLSQIQAKVIATTGMEQFVVSGSIAAGLSIKMGGKYGPQVPVTISANTLETSGSTAITFTIATSQAGESWGDAITRSSSVVQYFGLIITETCDVIGQTDLLAAAAIVQSLNKIAFTVSTIEDDIQVGGMIDLLRSGSLNQTRGLYYGDTDINALLYCAAYAGRGLSVNFSGSNTAMTMHLKQLSGIQPDPTLNGTTLTLAQAAGADVYISIQGSPGIFSSGKNLFFDQVYNRQAFVGALAVAAFNYLQSAGTKVTQTEDGMTGFKAPQRQVCEQYVTNAYIAPGTWTSATTFGNQTDFLNNIAQRGYYIYSTPISQQSQADRAARKAPPVQIAIKEAGAIHSGSIIVNINS